MRPAQIGSACGRQFPVGKFILKLCARHKIIRRRTVRIHINVFFAREYAPIWNSFRANNFLDPHQQNGKNLL
ncbi:unnamed protein product [Phytomonas sp. EM1]|nr:unnamed protein product [Phytomonas sp. EM1]|eukprot:CCW65234.1 unnamed protein product [Phytomonas sp. isolate EM1]